MSRWHCTLTRLAATACAVALLALLAGCGDSDPDRARTTARLAPPAPGTYAARVPGTQAYVAAVIDRDSVAGYLCDNGHTSAWFAARPHRDGRARLASRTRRATLALAPTATGLQARVRLPDGSARTVTLVRQTGRAGVYRATATTPGGGLQVGWIVLADGSQRGATTQFAGKSIDLARPAQTTAAPTLNTATGTVKLNTAGTVTATKLTQPGFMGKTIDL
jgi:hypothetical protein